MQLRSDLPMSGLTNWYKPRWLIILNSTEPSVRRRFSLMHEAKHVIDHERIRYLCPRTALLSSERRAELVADYFAACLLVPKRLVKRRFGERARRQRPGRRVRCQSRRHGVPPAAARPR
ncbi:MAG TPA: ImmA/IrrE family metallo-endopeptidase [Acidimicrobiales bacterium]